MPKSSTTDITTADLAELIDSNRFPPILTPDQTAELFQISKATVYRWSSEGRYKQAIRRGKPLRILRDRLIQAYFQGE